MRKTLSLDHICMAIILAGLPLVFLPRLPTMQHTLLLALIGLLLLIVFYRYRMGVLLGCIFITFSWGCLVANAELVQIERYVNRTLRVTVEISSINLQQQSNNIIIGKVYFVDGQRLPIGQRFNIRLQWSNNSQPMMAGQQWDLQVKTRPVHSRLNQGGFDSQRWAIANRLAIKGVVKQGILNQPKPNLRQTIIDSIGQQIASYSTHDILLGLAFGERGLLSAQNNRLLLETGTAHLMAISGLHISLAALFGWSVARASQYLLPVSWIEPQYPRVIGWLTALIYVWLSGANLPAIRAMLALTWWLFLRWRGHLLSPWQIWRRVVALLLLCDPLMILSTSAWLSCGAVACLIFWYKFMPLPTRFSSKSWFLLHLLHLQLAIFLLLLPLQLIVFNGISLSSLVANLLAVPMVSFVTVPAIFVALLLSVLPVLSHYCWWIADKSLDLLLVSLNSLQGGWWDIPHSLSTLAILGWLWVIVWRLSLWRCAPILLLSLAWLLVSFILDKPAYRWRVDMLDVGHGLAVVIHNGQQAIIYDTASRWRGSSIAEKAILPFLRWHGLQLEGIILSHQDSDHAGGLTILQQAYPQHWLLSSSTQLNGLLCQQGKTLTWRNLTLQMLWPLKPKQRAYNADSCVIKISDGNHSLLLTGDLEAKQEAILVKTQADRLGADILQVPHHGSKTSSTNAFLGLVKPRLALISAGRFNPWQLPAASVKRRYQQHAIDLMNTADSGQISLVFHSQKVEILTYRQNIMPRWYHQSFGSVTDNE